MINIFPPKIFKEYLISVHKYNLWFIKLRYYAVAALVLLLIVLKYLLLFEPSTLQIISYLVTTVFILGYNFYFMKCCTTFNENNASLQPLQLSFYQMALDLLSLSILVYFMGGIEAPIFMFYIFHMIIGSLLLPLTVMFIFAGVIIVTMTIFSILEYCALIPHQGLVGLYHNPLYNDIHFVTGFIFMFGVALFISIILTNKIVSELYSRERHLKNVLEQLNEAEKSKQKYIMAVVHDLKSPIAAVVSLLDLILGGYVGKYDDSVKEKIIKAKERGEDSISDINEILHISRFKLMNELDKKELSMKELLNKNIELVKPTAERKKIEISVKYSSDNKFDIMGDKVLLNLALSNLLSNSVKYTPDNGHIIIKMEIKNNKLIFEIIDDGIGIPVKDQENIFNDFYRASNVADKKIEGTGTGLSAVKQIIDMHGGLIKVDSPVNKTSKERPGTSFNIILPA